MAARQLRDLPLTGAGRRAGARTAGVPRRGRRRLPSVGLLATLGAVSASDTGRTLRHVPPSPAAPAALVRDGAGGEVVAAGPPRVEAARTADLTLTSGGAIRRYRLHVPPLPAGGATGSLPLVVAFHGAGSTVAQQERASGLSALADRERFLVAYPEGAGRRWASAPGAGSAADVGFARELVAEVARRYPVDPERVYATGISNGAGMASRVACDAADLFAAAATVAGAYPPRDDCRPSRPVPVLAVHGLADRAVPFGGRAGDRELPPVSAWAAGWAARDGCAPSPVVTRTAAVTTRAWTGCADGAAVVLHAVDGLGHAWPRAPADDPGAGAPLDATAAMWAFFQAHPRPRHTL